MKVIALYDEIDQKVSLLCFVFVAVQVNSFIDCFVAVRRITSIYDLERAICKSESVNNFEDLGLGPLLRHPLVIHYFSLGSGMTQVFKIASDEIIQLLSVFLDVSKSKTINSDDEFLDFIAKKRSVECREWLGIRISNLRYVMSCSSYILFWKGCAIVHSIRKMHRT